jgi:hypothetical protein
MDAANGPRECAPDEELRDARRVIMLNGGVTDNRRNVLAGAASSSPSVWPAPRRWVSQVLNPS